MYTPRYTFIYTYKNFGVLSQRYCIFLRDVYLMTTRNSFSNIINPEEIIIWQILEEHMENKKAIFQNLTGVKIRFIRRCFEKNVMIPLSQPS